jgi:gas vesicle protein GvpL/GvpF
VSHADRDPLAGLERWAAQRAPELVARAEEEAVAVLRDTLLAAAGLDGGSADVPSPPALGSRAAADRRRASPRQERVAREAAPAAQRPDLLWAYCVLHDGDATPDGAGGIAGRSVERIAAHGLAALVSHVPAAEFAAEPLTRNLNDLGWLERVARAHEAVLDAALAQNTIVPLRMCTIFESEDGVTEMLERRRRSLSDALSTLAGRLEWAVKVLVDRDRLLEAARPQDAGIGEINRTGEGGAYLQRRREERGAREAASRLATDTAEQIHARLQDWAIDARTRPPQNRELSGHEGEMVLNAAYLIERERTDELRAIVAELEEHHHGLGARIELTGPWPPYNFVPGAETPASA